jgi:hypothetical protein
LQNAFSKVNEYFKKIKKLLCSFWCETNIFSVDICDVNNKK